MATATVAFKCREDHRKQIELVEARKAGLAPAELDEDGKEINPHIPQYMSCAPWYLKSDERERPSLKHQRKRKSADPNYTKSWYDRGAKTFQAEKYRKGACKNCGGMKHNAKDYTERPRKVGAKYTNKMIAPDEKIESFELDYDGKRDRWNGYDPSTYERIT
ncbi:Pre-mRNA-splicing factor SLU7-A [Cardamine amara subsp. amara]|uniref:Pre-mRNA-splicing factor SLU7 n=1 Tax=Cardamine amara subsp. amara TaxID=228776 RepID=A0ABD1C6A9_CARAN